MCGIAGIASIVDAALPAPAVIEQMCRMITHRGPDDQGVLRTPRAHIGMRRLSIIDVGGGHQPIHNEDETVWIVFNGEIYNFASLRRELEALGHRFYTNSDTECIVHAYEQFGDDCFSRLRGMFAIALLDRRRDRLVLARDRVGKKPLYYTITDDGLLAFGSELKCLLAVPSFRPSVEPEAIHDYFALGYVPAPASIFAGVRKLLPAHYLVLENGRVSTARYWNLQFAPKWNQPESELTAQLLQHLEDAVRVRLVSDVPFGAFLSGGIDSSVVAALMARTLSSPVRTFTIGFREDAFNEMPDARLVARHIGADHHELVVDADAASLLQHLVWHFDEPFGDSSAIPTFLVSRLAAGHVKMVLSGDGGDEFYGGYTRYRKFMHLRRIARGSAGLAARIARSAGRGMRGLGIAGGERVARIGARLGQPFPDNYLSGVAVATQNDLQTLLVPELAGCDPYRSVRSHFERPEIDEEMERVIAGDVATYLSDDILTKVDRMTMANSIESRAPLLDQELVAFTCRLPLSLKIRRGVGKYLLRKAAQQLLPAACLQKRKQGFAIPLDSWFRSELKTLLMDTIADRRFRQRGICNMAGVHRLLNEHLGGTHNHGELLWQLLTYEMWARRFLDGQPTGAPGYGPQSPQRAPPRATTPVAP
jgi:asparagine synthase (glutamine-hydrolysing)